MPNPGDNQEDLLAEIDADNVVHHGWIVGLEGDDLCDDSMRKRNIPKVSQIAPCDKATSLPPNCPYAFVIWSFERPTHPFQLPRGKNKKTKTQNSMLLSFALHCIKF